ncbi:MAG: PAS domain S-box protein, partial [Bacteroidota bacterium]|nr:PAS domain S-box protein [Bacteroidota bacterium]
MKTKTSRLKQKPAKDEDKYRSMIESIRDAFMSIDANGNFMYVNRKASKILERKKNYLAGKNIWSEFPGSLNHEFKKAFKKAIAFRKVVYLEEYHTANGVWFENHIYPSTDGVSVYMKDVTKRKRKEINALRLAKRNELLLDTMQNSFLLTDAKLNIIDVNPAFCKTIGYTRKELLKMNVADFDVEFSPDEIKQNFIKVAAGNVLELETKNRKKDGSVIDVEVVLTEMEIDGEIYFASFGRDISGRKKAEQQILSEKQLSDSIINSLPGIFYLYDINGKFLKWNKNFEMISKYSAAEIEHISPLDFFDDDEKTILTKKINTVFRTGTEQIEAHFFTKDREKISYFFNGSRAQIDGKICLIGMGIDITEINKAREALRLMEQEVLNQKVQEQKKITRAVIQAEETERNYIGCELHDNVNQILAGTKLYLTMAGKNDEKIRGLLGYPLALIDSSISEIRALSSKYVTPPGKIDLKELAKNLVEALNKNTSIKTTFNFSFSDQIMDEQLKLNLYRIIQEQINNILKHAAPTAVAISLKGWGNAIHLVTTDNGKGFDL